MGNDIGERMVKQLANILKVNQVTSQRSSIDRLGTDRNVSYCIRTLNLQKNDMNPRKMRSLADALKINNVRRS